MLFDPQFPHLKDADYNKSIAVSKTFGKLKQTGVHQIVELTL